MKVSKRLTFCSSARSDRNWMRSAKSLGLTAIASLSRTARSAAPLVGCTASSCAGMLMYAYKARAD